MNFVRCIAACANVTTFIFTFHQAISIADVAPGPHRVFFWTQENGNSLKNGCYGYIRTGPATVSTTFEEYASSLWLLPKYQWWLDLFRESPNLTSKLIVSNQQPAAIIRATTRYSGTQWLTGFERTDSTGYAIRFLFPMLPEDSAYGRYDHFTIDVDSSSNLEFYGAGDSIMVGTFVHKRPDTLGRVNLLARNAFIVELTRSNPFRIKSIRCNGAYSAMISKYLGFDLTELKKSAAWYGLDLVDTTPPPNVNPGSVVIEGSSPYAPGTVRRVTWTPGNVSQVDSFLIHISFDSAATWSRTGKVLRDSLFMWTVPNHASSTSFLRITACGSIGERVSSKSSPFRIAIPIGFTISVQSYTASSVIAEWNPGGITVPGKRALCIAYRTGTPVAALPGSDFDTLMYPLTATRDTITGLDKGGMWYFTVFVRDSAGAFVIAGPNATDSALAADLTPPQNPFTLKGIAIDSTGIRLSWSSEAYIGSDIDTIGIWIDKHRFPISANDGESELVGFLSLSDSCDTVRGLKPSTTYYFALFVADSSGNWSDSGALVHVRTPSAPGRTDSANAVAILGNDTQSVFSDSLRIWSGDLETVYRDTIDPWDSPASEGFIEIGPAFTFRQGTLPAGHSITMQLKTNLIPEYYSEDDLRVYRYDITRGGGWLIEKGPVTSDSSGNLVVTTNDVRLPFHFMIDTSAPVITVLSNDGSAYTPYEKILDTFTVADNVKNLIPQLLVAPGNMSYYDISALYIDTVAGQWKRFVTTIPSYAADPCSGLRGLFRISDGKNTNFVNLSRKIKRDGMNCDDRRADTMSWTPLVVTAIPDRPLLSDLLSSSRGAVWEYDTKAERIIRWLPDSGNESSLDKWVEYSEKDSSLFAVLPGRLSWIKSGRGVGLRFGSAIVPALIDTFEITLKKGEWTDFSIPFNFDILSKDIMAATSAKTAWAADSIEIYRWSGFQNTFTTEPAYLPGIVGLSDEENLFQGGGPFTAYNSSGSAMTLRIPPVCRSLSDAGGAAKRTSRTAWSVKITSTDRRGNHLPPIYCAGAPEGVSGRLFPMPPVFLTARAGIVDETTGKIYGHTSRGRIDKGGALFRIGYLNSGTGPEIVTSRIEQVSGLPSGMSAVLYGENEKSPAPPSCSRSLMLPGNGGKQAYLVVGTGEYIGDFYKRITSAFSFFPYVHNGVLRINYSLPPGVRSLAVSIFDLRGRRIDRIVKNHGLGSGTGALTWEAGITRGYYIIRMTALLDGAKEPLCMNRRWLNVR